MRILRESLKTATACMVALAALIATFALLTLLHGSIPSELTQAHMEESLHMLDEEGIYGDFGDIMGNPDFDGFAGQGNRSDNYTNMWMIQSADSTHRFHMEEFEPGEPYDTSKREYIDETWMGQSFVSGWRYGHYWNGYRVILKPLLIVTNLAGLRAIQMLLIALSLVWATRAVARHIGSVEALLLVISVLAINPLNILIDFSQGPDLIQALLSIVTVLWLARKGVPGRWMTVFFLSLGALEVFINCLVTPLVTLGMPLIAYLLWQRKHGISAKRSLIEGAKECVAWGVGYAGSFISVWCLSALFTHDSIRAFIREGIRQFAYRTGGDDASLAENILFSIQNNVNLNVPFLWLIMLGTAVLAILVWRQRGGVLTASLASITPLLATSALPFIWFIVLNNHSRIHSWMTHDILMISIWSLLCCAAYLVVDYSHNLKPAK